MEEICQHKNILIVTERPTDGEHFSQADRTFVECTDCLEILPVQTVTQEIRMVPLVVLGFQTS